MEINKNKKIAFNIVAIICVIIFCFALAPKSLQNDTFYTIKIGEHILQNGIDNVDPFSWHENLPYTYPHWLYDVGIYLIYEHLGGMTGIYISTIVISCILGVSLYYIHSKLSKNNLTSFILTLGVIYLLAPYIAARAQLVTFILFAWTIYFIEKFLETKKIRYAIGLIIIPIVIANIHCAVWPFYFILYLPYIAEYLICLILDSHFIYKIRLKSYKDKIKKLTKKGKIEKVKEVEEKINNLKLSFAESSKKAEKRRLNPYKIKLEKKDAGKWLIVIMLICILTGLLTPLGDTPYTYLVKTMQGNTTKSISEHLPLVLADSFNISLVVVLFISILIFTDAKIKLSDLFMLAGLVFLMFMTRRQFSMVALICGIIFNKLVCSLFNKYDPEGTTKMLNFITKKLGITFTILFILLLGVYFYKDKIDDNYINPNNYPIEATDYIKENLDLKNIKLFNDYNYGSYLLYQGVPVFIDSRADLYAPEFSGWEKDIFKDFINIASLDVYYEDKFQDYGITHVITYKNSKLNMLLSRDNKYKELYKDDQFIVYERKK